MKQTAAVVGKGEWGVAGREKYVPVPTALILWSTATYFRTYSRHRFLEIDRVAHDQLKHQLYKRLASRNAGDCEHTSHN